MKKSYVEYTKNRSKRSFCVKNLFRAFYVGGFVCCIGMLFTNLYLSWGLSKDLSTAFSTITLIFIAGLLTGIGVFDKIGKYAGAGTLVPITGFANSVAAPAIENKSEGYVFGMASKMFVIAGPVIVFGLASSMIYGFVYWLYLLTRGII